MSEVKEMSAVTLNETNGGKVLEIQLTGKLTKEDYEQFVPAVERLVKEHGRIRILVEMHDFHGWTAGALWQDIKFDAKHFKDIERVAMVGETKWQHGMAMFCKPFTTAKIRYFDRAGDRPGASLAGLCIEDPDRSSQKKAIATIVGSQSSPRNSPSGLITASAVAPAPMWTNLGFTPFPRSFRVAPSGLAWASSFFWVRTSVRISDRFSSKRFYRLRCSWP